LTDKGSGVNKRKTKTTIEIHQVYVIRPPGNLNPVRCSECAMADAWMVTPEEAATVTGLTLRRIYARVEAGTLHYQERGDGSLLVCFSSLSEMNSGGVLPHSHATETD